EVNGISKKRKTAVAQTLLVPAADAPRGAIQLASLDVTPERSAAKRGSQSRSGKDVVVLQRKANVRTHTIRSGDTLFSLAKRYNTSVNELRKLNNLKGSMLSKGKQLRVPGTGIRG